MTFNVFSTLHIFLCVYLYLMQPNKVVCISIRFLMSFMPENEPFSKCSRLLETLQTGVYCCVFVMKGNIYIITEYYVL